MWIKYRHEFSSGPSDWEWKDIGPIQKDQKDQIDDVCHDIRSEYDWDDDHYRGIEYELVELPPKEILQQKIAQAKLKIKWLKYDVSEYEKLLEKCQ